MASLQHLIYQKGRRLLVSLKSCMLFFGIFFISSTCFSQIHFTAKLTGAQGNPAVTSSATGTGVFLLTDEGLEFNITIDGLEMTNAHFHRAATGLNGGVVRGLAGDFIGNTAAGIWTSADDQPLTDELIADLLAGNLYVNVHTAANPGGEIRGQVILSSGTGFTATLRGDQVNPAVATAATGTGFFTLIDSSLVFSVTVDGLEATNAHFHRAATGANGGVVRSILGDFNGNTASGIWTSSDDQPLTQELITDLLLGNLYINVHTAANPGGEIRGQVNLSSGIGFTANLGGDQVNPPLATAASGTGAFTLTNAGLVFNISVEGLDKTNAHFHRAAAGANGGVARGILSDFTGNTAAGVWRRTDAQPLTDELIAELMAGNLYINVHTAANPGGEIRGQVNLNSGAGFTAKLRGDQVNPAVASPAIGTGSFMLTDTGLVFAITIEGLEMMTNAHFHRAATGANGGVVRGILNDFNGNTASGVWRPTDTQPLTDELIADLLAGNLYVNVHTAANPGGEIRGQVNLSSGTNFTATLSGDQANPAIVSPAMGTGVFTLTDSALVFNISVQGLEMTNAHFHRAATGANGGVVRGILGDFTGNTATGIWRRTDDQPLTDELIADLLAGNLYVNVHTAANPGGEIRGQVVLSSGIGFRANLMGEQQNPAVATAASGTGAFTLTDAGLVFNTTVTGLDFTNAHFHNAPIGSNGGVVRSIINDFEGKTASGVWRSTDDQPLSVELIGELLLGNIYVNLHTSDNPGGEIRGQLSPFDFVSSVELIEETSGSQLRKFNLSQNFPNPFSSSTEIRFDLNQSGHTVLKIYNLAGTEVATLVNENLQSGSYKVSFETNTLVSGTYIYHLQSNGLSEVRKMMLFK